MKMAFLVICPGSFQYDEEKRGESETVQEREKLQERWS